VTATNVPPATGSGPVRPEERLVHLDILRGFALLGILLVNFEFFSRAILNIVQGADPSLTGLDRAVDWTVMALAEGKFYALFSVLFGAGFALMWERAQAAGRGFYGLYFRRLAVLAVFGLAHGALVWAGDILFVYAVTGFVMTLLFRKTPQSRLVKWAIAFLAVPVLLNWSLWGMVELSRADPGAHAEVVASFEMQQRYFDERIARTEAIYATGSFAEATRERFGELMALISFAPFWVLPVLGYFLLGRWLLVSGRLKAPDRFPGFFAWWRRWGLLLGLVSSLAAASLLQDIPLHLPSLQLAVGGTLAAIGAPMLMLGYMGQVLHHQERLKWLAPAGRMALTNYLLQSLVWTTVFLGYGLGLWGAIPRAVQPLVVVGFFVVQAVMSRWWMRRFRFGPMEWVWRRLVYLGRLS
jgi:uncharacterized protein